MTSSDEWSSIPQGDRDSILLLCRFHWMAGNHLLYSIMFQSCMKYESCTNSVCVIVHRVCICERSSGHISEVRLLPMLDNDGLYRPLAYHLPLNQYISLCCVLACVVYVAFVGWKRRGFPLVGTVKPLRFVSGNEIFILFVRLARQYNWCCRHTCLY